MCVCVCVCVCNNSIIYCNNNVIYIYIYIYIIKQYKMHLMAKMNLVPSPYFRYNKTATTTRRHFLKNCS